MTKIEIDSDIEMLTNKQLKINVLKFLDNYRNILINKIKAVSYTHLTLPTKRIV